MFKEAGLRWMDRSLGFIFGVLRGVVVAIVLVLVLAAFASSGALLAGSAIAPYLLAVGQGATWVAPSGLRAAVHDGMLRLRGLAPQEPAKPSAASPAKR